MQEAIKTREDAYAPYSNFLVGAALLLEDNTIVRGNNQENAAYPSGLCAERVAIYHAGAQHPHLSIKTIAITAGPRQGAFVTPVPPCGACRQSILEYESKQKEAIRLLFMGTTGEIYEAQSMNDLLPFSFSKEYL
jgi:cytidine deaminase (EC 3.5.4.5)